jgi:hypothetical protein
MRIACLHTAESNIAVFDAALAARGAVAGDCALRHAVRADLLAAAERMGGLDATIMAETVAALADLSGDADAVLLTCSTLGPAVATAKRAMSVPVLRVDQALAEAAAKRGGHVLALCAVATTVAPTRDLFEEAARATAATVEVRLVEGAWDAFKAGDRPRYLAMVGAAADEAFRAGVATVALAQASMAGAAALCRAGTPLTSPAVGLAAAIAAADFRSSSAA